MNFPSADNSEIKPPLMLETNILSPILRTLSGPTRLFMTCCACTWADERKMKKQAKRLLTTFFMRIIFSKMNENSFFECFADSSIFKSDLNIQFSFSQPFYHGSIAMIEEKSCIRVQRSDV